MKKLGIRHILLILSVGFVVTDFMFTGIPKMMQLKRELKNIDIRIEIIEKENTHLQAVIGKLQSDPLVIETIAREELGMARPGEIVYQLPIERIRQK